MEVYQLKKSEEDDTVLVDVEFSKKQERSREGNSRSKSCQEF